MKHLQPLTIAGFNGRWNRGDVEIVPSDHFPDELNLEFDEHATKTRTGFEVFQELEGSWNGKVRRLHTYSLSGQVDRLLILDDDGNIWDEAAGFSSPILTIATPTKMTDFSVAVLNSRLYISPFNGSTALSGANGIIYVYDGSGVARPAAGSKPDGFTLTATKTGTGNVMAGKRLFQVCYETASGHFTRPGPSSATLYESPDSTSKVTIGNIPSKGSNVAVHILATQVIDSFSGNKLEYEFFFVPNASITDNSTSLELNFYDSELVDSADDLNWVMETIPAGLSLAAVDSRLVVAGPNANSHIAYVSQKGYPESFSQLSDFVETPNDGSGPVVAAAEFRGQLFLYKARRHYATSPSDNDPSSWQLITVDSAYGAEPHGVVKIVDVSEHTEDVLFTLDRGGIHRYSGNYNDSDLTYKVSDLWARINPDYAHLIHGVMIPDQSRLYCALPLDSATSPNYLLVGDFKKGYTPEDVRWSLWQLPRETTALTAVTDGNYNAVIYVGSVEGSVYRYTTTLRNDEITESTVAAIPSKIRTANLGDETTSLLYFGAYSALIRGLGTMNVQAFSIDETVLFSVQGFGLSTTPGRPEVRNCNVVSERPSFEFSLSAANHWFSLTSLTFYYGMYGTSRPR